MSDMDPFDAEIRSEVETLRAQNAGVGEQLVMAIDDIATLRARVAELERGIANVAAQARLCAGMCGARPAMVQWMRDEVTAVERAALAGKETP